MTTKAVTYPFVPGDNGTRECDMSNALNFFGYHNSTDPVPNPQLRMGGGYFVINPEESWLMEFNLMPGQLVLITRNTYPGENAFHDLAINNRNLRPGQSAELRNNTSDTVTLHVPFASRTGGHFTITSYSN